MSVLRQFNFTSQMRVDVSHLRSIDSSVAGDFDAVVGRLSAGSRALVVRGFALTNVGGAAIAAQMGTADGILVNLEASASGSFLWVPDDRAVETLNPATNARVVGAWTTSQTNYVGLDFARAADESTSDLVQFLDPTTDLETPRQIPLARTLDYTIVISTTPFAAQPNLVPVAKVVVDASGNITSTEDARPMMFRLGTGGDSPNRQNAFTWADGRAETVALNASGFIGGDKAIGDQKSWMDSMMTRMWELGGGEYWYSASADRNVQLVSSGTAFSNGDHFEWTGTNLHWQGLEILFSDSTGSYNTVNNQLVDSAGLTDLADGQCIYVDLNRTSNATINAQKATISTLGPGTPPGSRHILAWRRGSTIFTKGWKYPVGSFLTPATNLANGIVMLDRADTASPATPKVIGKAGGTIDGPSTTTALIVNGGAARLAAAFIGGAGQDGIIATGGTATSTGRVGVSGAGSNGAANGNDGGSGVLGVGGNAGTQASGFSADGGAGGFFLGGNSVDGGGGAPTPISGAGVRAYGGAGAVAGYGVWGSGGSAADGAHGGYFEGGAATSDDAGYGIYAIGGTTAGAGVGNLPGHGGYLVGAVSTTTAPGGSGAVGIGATSTSGVGGSGLVGVGAGGSLGTLAAPYGVYGLGGTNSIGVYGLGGANQAGVQGVSSGGTAPGVKGVADGAPSPANVNVGVYGIAATAGSSAGVLGYTDGVNAAIQGTSAGSGRAGFFTNTSTGIAARFESAGATARTVEIEGVGNSQTLYVTNSNLNGTTVLASNSAAGKAGSFSNSSTSNPTVVIANSDGSNTAIALQVGNGAPLGIVKLAGTNPTYTTAFSNDLTKKNIAKCWGKFEVNAGVITILDGFNIASAAVTGGGLSISITMASAMANTNYAAIVSGESPTRNYSINVGASTTIIDVEGYNITGAALIDFNVGANSFSFMVFGEQ